MYEFLTSCIFQSYGQILCCHLFEHCQDNRLLTDIMSNINYKLIFHTYIQYFNAEFQSEKSLAIQKK